MCYIQSKMYRLFIRKKLHVIFLYELYIFEPCYIQICVINVIFLYNLYVFNRVISEFVLYCTVV